MLKNKKFREDLYYRICVVPIYIPPLRERWEDTLLLAEGFINQFNEKYETSKYFSSDVRVWMNQYEWPGNVRELRNIIERLAIVADEDEIQISDVPAFLQKKTNNWNALFGQNVSLKDANENLEKALIQKVLGDTENSREAATTLGISQSTLLRKIHKYELNLTEL
jgi:transcriptional regulator with PAS, ATPase and Fis domain